MPLHLLGKKSWNVYNADNIARVRRDEAAAAAKEAAEEQRMQEEDSRRRMQLLRGERPEEQPEGTQLEGSASQGSRPEKGDLENSLPDPKEALATEDGLPRDRDRKRRRRHGEDDTDRDLRYAREEQARLEEQSRRRSPGLVDRAGHINLIEPPRLSNGKPERGDARASGGVSDAPGKGGAEDSGTGTGMRFADAADSLHGTSPWYASRRQVAPERRARNVWGRVDPRRAEREMIRLAGDDPMVAIQAGVNGVRAVKQDRQAWCAERDRELGRERKMEKHGDKDGEGRHRHRRHHRRGADNEEERAREERHGKHHRRRRRSRTGSRSRSRSGSPEQKRHQKRHGHGHRHGELERDWERAKQRGTPQSEMRRKSVDSLEGFQLDGGSVDKHKAE